MVYRMDGRIMARHVVQEMVVIGDRTLWEDRNEYYMFNDAHISKSIDQKLNPEKLYRIATIRYS